MWHKAKPVLFSKPAVFIYGFVTGWFTYLAVIILVLRNFA